MIEKERFEDPESLGMNEQDLWIPPELQIPSDKVNDKKEPGDNGKDYDS